MQVVHISGGDKMQFMSYAKHRISKYKLRALKVTTLYMVKVVTNMSKDCNKVNTDYYT